MAGSLNAPEAPMSILVVEETRGGRSSPTARFLSAGRPQYAVECATDVKAALSRLDRTCFDLVLLDGRLAREERELLRARGRSAGANTAFVLLDDAVTPEARREAAESGAVDVLARTADGMEALFRTADSLCELRHMRERRHLLLKDLYGEETIGPCSTGGTRPR